MSDIESKAIENNRNEKVENWCLLNDDSNVFDVTEISIKDQLHQTLLESYIKSSWWAFTHILSNFEFSFLLLLDPNFRKLVCKTVNLAKILRLIKEKTRSNAESKFVSIYVSYLTWDTKVIEITYAAILEAAESLLICRVWRLTRRLDARIYWNFKENTRKIDQILQKGCNLIFGVAPS